MCAGQIRASSRSATAAAPSDYATAGMYAVRSSILREAEAARRDGVDALRTFLGRLLDRGYHLAGIPIARSIDVDRPADIRNRGRISPEAWRYETAARIISGNAILARPSSIERCSAARSDCASAAGTRIRSGSPDPRRSGERRTDAAIIFSMCQGRSSLENLADWEREGAKIINSPRSALNTHRDRLPALMVEAGVSFPQTQLVGTRESVDLRIARSQRRHLAEARRCPRLGHRGCAMD